MVREGDTLTTATAASAQISMLDGGLIAVRSDTKFKFDTLKFNGTQDGSKRSFFSLFTGGFRAVTGLIGKLRKSSFHITTPAAVIGIRRIDHKAFVVTAGSPMAAFAYIGTYNKVNWQGTTLTTDRGTISILPNQVGYVSAADQMPELKPLNINIFTVESRPLTEVKTSEKEDKPVRKTASADKSEKKKITVAAVISRGRESDKALRETVTEGHSSKKKVASTLASSSWNNKAAMSSTHPNIARIPHRIQGFGVPVAIITIIDPVTTINWGRWNDSINVAGPVTRKVTTFAPEPKLPWAAGSTGIVGNAGSMETDAAALPVSDNNTDSNAQRTGTAPTNNPKSVGANQNGSASQYLINDYMIFKLPNNSNGLVHRRSGRAIIPWPKLL